MIDIAILILFHLRNFFSFSLSLHYIIIKLHAGSARGPHRDRAVRGRPRGLPHGRGRGDPGPLARHRLLLLGPARPHPVRIQGADNFILFMEKIFNI